MGTMIPQSVAERLARGELVAAIAQDCVTNEVLMLAWMNEESLAITVESRNVTYWSRSRQALWRKGESSGHTQRLIALSYDCDGDALLLKIEQTGAACHTGERSCFFSEIELP